MGGATLAPGATVCARCGHVGNPDAMGGCARCAAPLEDRPSRPPALERCPACGATTARTLLLPLSAGRATGACAGCGFAMPRPAPQAVPEVLDPARRRVPPTLVVAAVLALVVAVVAVVRSEGDDGLDLRWRTRLGTGVVGPPVVEGTTALLATGTGELVALDVATGRPRWRFATDAPLAGPAVAANGVAAVVAEGEDAATAYAIDTRTGEERWRVELPGFGSAPALAEGAVVVGGEVVVAVEAASGDVRWRREVVGGRSVAAGAGLAVVTTGDGVVALDLTSGVERWRWDGRARPEVAPVVTSGLVVAPDGTGGVVGLDPATGAPRWQVGTGGLLRAAPVASGSGVVLATVGGVVAVDAAGEERWRSGPSGDPRLRVASDGSTVAVVAGDLELRDDGGGRLGSSGVEGGRGGEVAVAAGVALVAAGGVVEARAAGG